MRSLCATARDASSNGAVIVDVGGMGISQKSNPIQGPTAVHANTAGVLTSSSFDLQVVFGVLPKVLTTVERRTNAPGGVAGAAFSYDVRLSSRVPVCDGEADTHGIVA